MYLLSKLVPNDQHHINLRKRNVFFSFQLWVFSALVSRASLELCDSASHRVHSHLQIKYLLSLRYAVTIPNVLCNDYNMHFIVSECVFPHIWLIKKVTYNRYIYQGKVGIPLMAIDLIQHLSYHSIMPVSPTGLDIKVRG